VPDPHVHRFQMADTPVPPAGARPGSAPNRPQLWQRRAAVERRARPGRGPSLRTLPTAAPSGWNATRSGGRRQRVEPRGEVFAVEDDRHPLVKVARRFVRCRR